MHDEAWLRALSDVAREALLQDSEEPLERYAAGALSTAEVDQLDAHASSDIAFRALLEACAPLADSALEAMVVRAAAEVQTRFVVEVACVLPGPERMRIHPRISPAFVIRPSNALSVWSAVAIVSSSGEGGGASSTASCAIRTEKQADGSLRMTLIDPEELPAMGAVIIHIYDGSGHRLEFKCEFERAPNAERVPAGELLEAVAVG